MVAEPVRIGDMGSKAQAHRIYSIDGKSVCINSGGGGLGAKTGLYAIPKDGDIMLVKEATQKGYAEIKPGECVDLCEENSKTRRGRKMAEKSNCLTTTNAFYEYCGTVDKPIYQVRDGMITIKDKQYLIKLKDGFYIIHKLTVTECCRLQGMPDWWFLDNNGNKILSDTQAYKGLGNGWQLDTVKYILEHGLKNIPKNEEIVVLSMYDGIATGRRILEELGFTNIRYYAYEIDKYCIKLTSYRYPDIIHCGDAFKIRNKGEIEKII